MKKLKNIFVLTLSIIIMLFSLTCYAALPDEAFSAEKLFVGGSFAAASQLYGNPVSSKMGNDKSTINYYKTPNGIIGVVMGMDSTIGRIIINEAGGKTAAGIQVGSTISEVNNIYGRPTFTGKDYYSKKGSVLDVFTYNRELPQQRLKQLSITMENNKVVRIVISYGMNY